jgi:co-chaperonin GroES (HSP10)
MQVNTSEATVLAAGAGRLTAEGERFPPWPRAGDIVTFAPEKAQALGDGEALIDAEDVIGLVRSDGSLYPLSDWVQVIPDPKAHESKGGIRLSDRVQRYRIRGTVLEYGPGLLEVEGTCAVRRRTVHEILNLPPDFDLSGRDVFWKRDARVVQLGREQVECWLVSAGDLIGYLE